MRGAEAAATGFPPGPARTGPARTGPGQAGVTASTPVSWAEIVHSRSAVKPLLIGCGGVGLPVTAGAGQGGRDTRSRPTPGGHVTQAK